MPTPTKSTEFQSNKSRICLILFPYIFYISSEHILYSDNIWHIFYSCFILATAWCTRCGNRAAISPHIAAFMLTLPQGPCANCVTAVQYRCSEVAKSARPSTELQSGLSFRGSVRSWTTVDRRPNASRTVGRGGVSRVSPPGPSPSISKFNQLTLRNRLIS